MTPPNGTLQPGLSAATVARSRPRLATAQPTTRRAHAHDVTDDAQLDRVSRQILSDLEEVKQLEERKRRAARSSGEFHELAHEVERAARHAWEHAHIEEEIARDDSPIPAERAEQELGDWTRRGEVNGNADRS
jgi:hypothetical protein